MPKLIVKSGYIKNIKHIFNVMEYSGNKIDSQNIIFQDRTVLTVNKDEKVDLSKYGNVKGVCVHFKDDTTPYYFTKESYKANITEKVTVENIQTLEVTNNEEKNGPHDMKDLDFYKYLSYIENRPGVEKIDDKGLFSLEGNISISEAKRQVEQAVENGVTRFWSHIISMDAVDAVEKNFNNREAWKNLVLSNADKIAKTYNISIENLVINAAFHGNTDNAHIHMIFYSKNSKEGYIVGGTEALNKASEKLKSIFTNDIFKDEVTELKTQINKNRQTMKKELNMALKLSSIDDAVYNDFLKLQSELKKLKGKKEYGYIPQELKKLTNNILKNIIENNKQLNEEFTKYLNFQKEYVKLYAGKEEKIDCRLDKIKNKLLNPTKNDNTSLQNIIIKEALKNAPYLAWPELKNAKDILYEDDNLIIENVIKQSAERCNQFAQYKMGSLYLSKEEIEKDVDKAISYLEQSAEQGNSFAKCELGKQYLYGNNIDKNIDMAMNYLCDAMRDGNSYAEEILLNYHNQETRKAIRSIGKAIFKFIYYQNTSFSMNNEKRNKFKNRKTVFSKNKNYKNMMWR